ncbi:MAG: hypothetical protein IPJ28_23460 [Betaproteobacteria bacterium]|nr:hypothetical protein [Betaproteobacteria bacterium]
MSPARSSRKKPPASFRFYVSPELQDRLEAVLARIEGDKDATRHHAEFSETLVTLVAEGLDYYFLRTVKAARAGFLLEQTAALGIASVQKVMGPVVPKIAGRLDHDQLRSVAATMRELMK